MSFKTVTFRIPRDSELFQRLQALVQGQEVPWSKAVLRELENTQQELPLPASSSESEMEISNLRNALSTYEEEIGQLRSQNKELKGSLSGAGSLRQELSDLKDKLKKSEEFSVALLTALIKMKVKGEG